MYKNANTRPINSYHSEFPKSYNSPKIAIFGFWGRQVQTGVQIHICMKRADPSSEVCHNLAWRQSYGNA